MLTKHSFVATVFACTLSLGGCGTISSIFGPPPPPPPPAPMVYGNDVNQEPSESYSMPSHHHDQVMGHDSMVQVQQALAAKGYYWGKVDGIDGPMTVRAVQEFQYDLGVPVTGVVGHEEWSALGL